MKDTTPSVFKKHWESRMKVLQYVLDGLDGKPFNWGTQGETKTYLRLVREMGITLVTKNQLEKLGHKLKRDVIAVGKVNFGAPFGEALFLVREWLKAERLAFVYRPGTVPLLPYLIGEGGQTVTEVMVKTGAIVPLLPG